MRVDDQGKRDARPARPRASSTRSDRSAHEDLPGPSGPLSPEALVALQRAVGNRAVVQRLHAQGTDDRHTHGPGCDHPSVQRSSVDRGLSSSGSPPDPGRRAGVSVSGPSDRFEREVGATATRVMPRPPDHASTGASVQRAPAVVQRAPAGMSKEQRGLYSLAGRWKVQSSIALAMGRSEELVAVDNALAAWRQAVGTDPAGVHQDRLNDLDQAIRTWRANKPPRRGWFGSDIGYRAAHIKTLAKQVARVMDGAGATDAASSLRESVEGLDENEQADENQQTDENQQAGGQERADEGSEDEYFDERSVDEQSAQGSAAQPAGGEPEQRVDRWLVSTGKGMAVRAESTGNDDSLKSFSFTKDFFALERVVEDSNTRLAAQGSPLQLRLTAPAPGELGALGLRRVEPVMRVGGEERTGDQLLTVHECIVVAQQVTKNPPKSLDHVLLGPDRGDDSRVKQKQVPDDLLSLTGYPRMITRPGMTPDRLAKSLKTDNGYIHFNWRDHEIDLDPDDEDYDLLDDDDVKKLSARISSELADAGMNTGAASALLRTMKVGELLYFPALQQILVDRLESEGLLDNEPSEETRKRMRQIAEDVHKLKRSRNRRYEEEPDRERDVRLGINDAAEPRVGEAFGIYGTRHRKDQEKAADPERQTWSYHFAGVVARDGEDAVTLENYNRRADPDGSAKWYFGMYGPGAGRTFHGRYREWVDGAVTMVTTTE